MKTLKKNTLYVILIISLITILIGCSEKKYEDEVDKSKLVNYEILEVKENNTKDLKRYSYSILIKEEAKKENLEEVSKEIVNTAKDENNFNALRIGFYDEEEYVLIGQGYTLGEVEYGPNGKWEDADKVKTGSYREMDYTYKLLEKDWSKKPLKKEVQVVADWWQLFNEKYVLYPALDEKLITEDIAIKHRIHPDEVSELVNKITSWIYIDQSK